MRAGLRICCLAGRATLIPTVLAVRTRVFVALSFWLLRFPSLFVCSIYQYFLAGQCVGNPSLSFAPKTYLGEAIDLAAKETTSHLKIFHPHRPVLSVGLHLSGLEGTEKSFSVSTLEIWQRL